MGKGNGKGKERADALGVARIGLLGDRDGAQFGAGQRLGFRSESRTAKNGGKGGVREQTQGGRCQAPAARRQGGWCQKAREGGNGAGERRNTLNGAEKCRNTKRGCQKVAEGGGGWRNVPEGAGKFRRRAQAAEGREEGREEKRAHGCAASGGGAEAARG